MQANKAIVGRNAFAHESGIHQDGMLKDRRTYEIMNPEDVGVPKTTLVLGKHSGRHAVQKRCEELGFVLTKFELDRVYRQMTALADRQKHGVRRGAGDARRGRQAGRIAHRVWRRRTSKSATATACRRRERRRSHQLLEGRAVGPRAVFQDSRIPRISSPSSSIDLLD